MTRLDEALVARGLARSRAQARSLIDAGHVTLNGTVASRAARVVEKYDRVDARRDPYVSRGAHKLLGALDDLSLTVRGRALDAGSSTGGFTQVLLERGCRRVYAVDVGTGQLAAPLRSDPRVVVRERLNLRELTPAELEDEPMDLVVADVSFISLTTLLAPLTAVTRADGFLLVLVKPQFEVGRALLGKKGVVREPELRRAAALRVAEAAGAIGWPAVRCLPSRLPGPAGNREFFLLLRHGEAPPADLLVSGAAFD